MRIAGDEARARPLPALRLSAFSLFAFSAFTVGAPTVEAMAAERPAANRCASLGEGFVSLQGADGCLRVGGHVRVESQVMQGSARLGGGLPGYSNDGAAPAALRSDGATTRLRVHGAPGGLFAR